MKFHRMLGLAISFTLTFTVCALGHHWTIDYPTQNESFIASGDPATTDIASNGTGGPISQQGTARVRNADDTSTVQSQTVTIDSSFNWSTTFTSIGVGSYKVDVLVSGTRHAGPVDISVTVGGGGG
jgi:hypothetical protein